MDTVSSPGDGAVIAWMPFVEERRGEVVARHRHDGPSVDIRLVHSAGGEQYEFGLTPLEARALADELGQIADSAQRAACTPELVADVREHYLPRATDEEIVARLGRLVERLGVVPLLRPGVLRPDAGMMLTADAALDGIDRADRALTSAVAALTDLRRDTRDILRNGPVEEQR